ncbi:MAG: helix-turn-helix transcriptional regulator [Proteiniphilum sp.]
MDENLLRERIRQVIAYLRISDSAFAKNIHVKQNTLSQQLNGKRSISIEVIYGIADTYSIINCEWLITGKGDMLKHAVNESVDYKEKYLQLMEEKNMLHMKYTSALEELREMDHQKNIPAGTDSGVPDAKPETGT